MSLKSILSSGRPIKVSFEFSPPKTPEAEEQLWRAIRRLEPLSPAATVMVMPRAAAD